MDDLPKDFDAEFYLQLYPDVKAAGINAAQHYILHGREEGRQYRDPGNKCMPFTGERYVPEVGGTIALEHLHRYGFASFFVEGKAVLDIASGEGYGSEMLSRTAKRVYGVEIDPLAVKHASEKYKLSNLSFHEGSCEKIPLAPQSVDVVISFETIEHFEDHQMFMAEVLRVLRPDGLLIISTPSKEAYNNISLQRNPFHKKELERDEFQSLMLKSFSNVSLLGQIPLKGYAIIGPSGWDSKASSIRFSDLPQNISPSIGLPEPLYLLAFCSNSPLPTLNACYCS